MTVSGMLISHYIPHKFFWYWVVISLILGHLINLMNYKINHKEKIDNFEKELRKILIDNNESTLTHNKNIMNKVVDKAVNIFGYDENWIRGRVVEKPSENKKSIIEKLMAKYKKKGEIEIVMFDGSEESYERVKKMCKKVPNFSCKLHRENEILTLTEKRNQGLYAAHIKVGEYIVYDSLNDSRAPIFRASHEYVNEHYEKLT